MIIKCTTGSLLDADVDALVNTVNCVGVMGKGIALQFKLKYPQNFKVYRAACEAKTLRPGQMLTVGTDDLLGPRFIINFPTKDHWKGNSRIEYIQTGLVALVEELQRLKIKSVAVPPLGCGNGGLEWTEVAPLIIQAFEEVPSVDLMLFEPNGAPKAEEMPVVSKKPHLTRARALIIALMRLYTIPGFRLTKLEIQKLAYLLQVAGEPLKLRYVAHRFGPYADNLNHALQAIEGHYIFGFGDRTNKEGIYLLSGAADEAAMLLNGAPEATEHLNRVAAVIEGFENPHGMELLATLIWVTRNNMIAAVDAETAIIEVHKWNKRKAELFSSKQIRIAWDHLNELGWLSDDKTMVSNGSGALDNSSSASEHGS